MNVKQAVRRVLSHAGVEVRRPMPGRIVLQRRTRVTTRVNRDTLLGSLENAVTAGFRPASVIDVGAADGTTPLYDVFPDARHLLVEPLEEFRPALDVLARRLDAAIFTGTAGVVVGEAVFNVHPDLNGSSLLKEREDSDVNGYERRVPQSTLDVLCRQGGLAGPFLLKIDTQGAELDVLRGAESFVLPNTEMAVLEVSLMPFFQGGPEVAEIIEYMRARDFVPYDMVDLQYRPLDGAMSQADSVFVPADSPLRREHHYATREQRSAQNKAFERRRRLTSSGPAA